MKMQKRAVSALVATVLLILITVAAVGIIWGAIMPMINSATQYGQACMNARLNINTDSGYTCVNGTGTAQPGRVLVNIERGAEDFQPQGMQIAVSAGGQAKVYTIKNNQFGNLTGSSNCDDFIMMPAGSNGTAPFTNCPIMTIPGSNEARTYQINTGMITTIPTEAAVAVIVKVGNTEKVCDISSRVALSGCRAT